MHTQSEKNNLKTGTISNRDTGNFSIGVLDETDVKYYVTEVTSIYYLTNYQLPQMKSISECMYMIHALTYYLHALTYLQTHIHAYLHVCVYVSMKCM